MQDIYYATPRLSGSGQSCWPLSLISWPMLPIFPEMLNVCTHVGVHNSMLIAKQIGSDSQWPKVLPKDNLLPPTLHELS